MQNIAVYSGLYVIFCTEFLIVHNVQMMSQQNGSIISPF